MHYYNVHMKDSFVYIYQSTVNGHPVWIFGYTTDNKKVTRETRRARCARIQHPRAHSWLPWQNTLLEPRRPPAPQKFDTARNLGQCIISCLYIYIYLFYFVLISNSIEQLNMNKVYFILSILLIVSTNFSTIYVFIDIVYDNLDYQQSI